MTLKQAATLFAVLAYSSQLSAKCDFPESEQQTIRGSIFEDINNNDRRDRIEPGIAGVSVSNGCDVVVSDGGGNYQIPIYPTQILFISKPSGYLVKVDENNLPQFYYRHYPDGTPTQIQGTSVEWAWPVVEPTGPLPSFINFGLIPDPQQSSSFKAHAFADTQARFDLGEDMLREDLINPLINNPYGVEFGLTVGDVVYDNLALYDRHKQMMGLMNIPQWYLPGNHDINFASPSKDFANETYKHHFGPTYYSFNHGNVHFVALNNVEYAGNGKAFADSTYRGYIPENQLDWLTQDLANVATDKLIVIATHIPLVSEAADASGATAKGPETVNFDQLLEILAPYSNIYGLAGHDTSNSWKVAVSHEHGWHGQPWIAHTLAEVRGSGWTKGLKDGRGVRDAIMDDGNPNGFYVLKIEDTNLIPDFIPFPFGVDAKQNMRINLDPALLAPANGAVNRGALAMDTKLVVNLFDGGVRDKVVAKFNGGEPQVMTYTLRTDPYLERLSIEYTDTDNAYNEPAISAHVWEMLLPSDLPTGLNYIEVEAIDEFGQSRRGSFTYEISLP